MADQRADGVENAPGKTSGGGESAGGAYPHGADAKEDGTGGGGFMGHGGQSHQAYSGPGDKTDDSRDDEAAGEDNAVSKD